MLFYKILCLIASVHTNGMMNSDYIPAREKKGKSIEEVKPRSKNGIIPLAVRNTN